MTKKEIYLYGMTLMTTSHRLAADFPAPDTYCEIAQSHRYPGGETGTCAIVLAGLGLDVLLDGNFLGSKTHPELIAHFDGSTVSLALMTFDPDFEGLEDLVFIDKHTRTPFGRFGQFFADKSVRRWNRPNELAIQQANVVGIDPFFRDESAQAARLCQKHDKKFVTVDCKPDSATHCLSEVNVLSGEYLRDHFGRQDLNVIFSEYTRRTQGLVIFTFGDRELWFGRARQEIQRFAPFRVDVKSTLGAGDSFKAGAIYGLRQQMDDATLIRFASATAAAACMNYPLAAMPPNLDAITEIAGELF